MAGYANLSNPDESILSEKDSIVIMNNLESIKGGKTLDITGFGPTIIKAGHVIIRETATGLFKPMPLATNDTVYGSLPSGHTYAGILVATIRTAKPFAGIMIRGTVNIVASPFSLTSILSAVKTALPQLIFTADE
ncbi:hypothetical protein VB264_22735 [Arcicella aquatica]|uniref:Uncharacterized protein n=1 Tax=Arcicella aquatica TaxID=217141 RepID=A0ABU5QU53_9BACT|nr:hypothetical protein [Arcicella aquatica]MEA5260632.1 hypothetical protein [Arcicella aquatica]